MTNDPSVSTPRREPTAPDSGVVGIWLHRYAVFVAACTGLLVFAGGLVTSTDSGLSVPDWPLSYGQLFPPMVGNVRFEHGHRMVATFVGMLTIGLVIWLYLRETRRSVRRLGLFALTAVVLQGLLGGLTVLLLLPPGISIAHACLGQTFFCLVVSIALFTSPGWQRSKDVTPVTGAVNLRLLAAALTSLVYLQLLIGALMRHTGAGLAIPDFPLAFGRLIPSFEAPGVAVHFAHRVGALLVSVAALLTAGHALRHHRKDGSLTTPAVLIVGLVLGQILLGGYTIWTAKGVVPTTLHVLNGALILATSLVLTLRSFRVLVPLPQVSRYEQLVEQQVAS